MTVKTTRPAIVINGMDSIATKKNKAVLTLERSKNPIVLMTVVDSLKSQIIVEAKNSMAYKLRVQIFHYANLIKNCSRLLVCKQLN
ncbi:hypothetical protein, partial [Carboxylicivirga marina]|uniref:hypothetical protein n=1 Tax=Carboxylicivirga marina TaxID=2800988 RepID=UPI001F157CBE